MAPPPTVRDVRSSSLTSQLKLAQSSSPHRFLVNKKVQKPSTPGPSKLSQRVQTDTDDDGAPRPNSGPAASQFVKAPRFTVRDDRRTSFPPRSPSPNRSQFTFSSTAAVGRLERARDPPEDDDEEMLDNGKGHFTVTDPWSQESIPDPEKASVSTPYLSRSPKRRKLDGTDVASIPQSTPGRFKLPSTQTGQAFTGTDEGSRPNRRAFLTTCMPRPEPAEPLPEAFSPRRRGQKFVGGGLAAEVQSWVVEAGQAAHQRRRSASGTQGGDTAYTIKAIEAQGDGPVFVRGQMTGGRQAKAVLIASQKAEKVRAGDVVGIRLPSWEVQVLGESWVVGVDWRTTKELSPVP